MQQDSPPRVKLLLRSSVVFMGLPLTRTPLTIWNTCLYCWNCKQDSSTDFQEMKLRVEHLGIGKGTGREIDLCIYFFSKNLIPKAFSPSSAQCIQPYLKFHVVPAVEIHSWDRPAWWKKPPHLHILFKFLNSKCLYVIERKLVLNGDNNNKKKRPEWCNEPNLDWN